MSAHTFAGAINWSDLSFGKMETDPVSKRQTVAVTLNGRKPRFLLCKNENHMLTTRYGLDQPQEPGKEARRTQTAWVEEEDLQRSLRELDEMVVRTAVEQSKTWFKATLSEEVIRSRYKPLLLQKDGDDKPMLKFKVKCPPAKYPTDIFRRATDYRGEGEVPYHRSDFRILEAGGAHVYPTVSMIEVWFMSGGSSFGLSMQAEKMLVVEGDAHNPLGVFATQKPVRLVDPTAAARRDEGGGTESAARDHHHYKGAKADEEAELEDVVVPLDGAALE